MTTATMTLEEALHQLQPHVDGEFGRVWRMVTRELGYRQVGRALGRLVAKPTDDALLNEVDTSTEVEDDFDADAERFEVPPPIPATVVNSLRDNKQAAMGTRAYVPCTKHAELLADAITLYSVGDRSCRCTADSHIIEVLLSESGCADCRQLTSASARELAAEAVDSRKLPGIGYRGRGIWNKPVPRNKAGGLSCPNPGGYGDAMFTGSWSRNVADWQ